MMTKERTTSRTDVALRGLLLGNPTDTRPLVRARLSDSGAALIREQRALSYFSGPAGAYLLSPSFAGALAVALNAKSTVWALASRIETESGEDMLFPTVNEDVSAPIALPSGDREGIVTDPVFGQVVNTIYTFSTGILRVSVELAQDAGGSGIESFLANLFATRLRQGLDRVGISGSGAGEPVGLAVGGTVGTTGGAGTATTFTWTNLSDLESSVGASYKQDALGRNVGRYLMADNTFEFAKTLIDGSGRPLWQADPSGRTAGTLRGYPVSVDDHMPAASASARSIAFGDFQKALVLRVLPDARVAIFGEHFMASSGQIAYLLELRAGVSIVDTQAIRLFQHSAS